MVRLATETDLPVILDIYACAKEFMHTHGNPTQWNGAYPDAETLKTDIARGQLYVITDESGLHGCFALIGGEDPTYHKIDGAWRSDTPYGTIHRIASDRRVKGIFEACFRFAKEHYAHLRVDTHEDNRPMQGAVTKQGFSHRGTIYLPDGAPRMAFDWLRNEEKP